MAEQSSMHPYLSWTKERIDEMDAVPWRRSNPERPR